MFCISRSIRIEKIVVDGLVISLTADLRSSSSCAGFGLSGWAWEKDASWNANEFHWNERAPENFRSCWPILRPWLNEPRDDLGFLAPSSFEPRRKLSRFSDVSDRHRGFHPRLEWATHFEEDDSCLENALNTEDRGGEKLTEAVQIDFLVVVLDPLVENFIRFLFFHSRETVDG